MRIVEISARDVKTIKQFLNTNKKLEAVKFLVDTYDLSLRDVNKVIKKITDNPKINIFNITTKQNFKQEIKDSLHTKTSKTQKIMYYIFVFIGLCLLLGGIINLGKTLNSLADSEKLSAIITRYESYISVSDTDNGKISNTMYTPVMQFTFKGKVYERKTKTSSSSRDYVINEQVSIYVHKDFPAVNEVYLDDFIEKYGLTIALLLFGILLTGVGFILKSF
ncbi:DUF3592 domain-containing protein [Aquimarina sp. M1]